jgi:hypothetical protein
MQAGTDRPQAGGDRRGFFRRDGRRDRRSFYRTGRAPASRESPLRPDCDEPHRDTGRIAKKLPSTCGRSTSRASVGSTEASASLAARVGVVGPTRARGKNGDSLGRTNPGVNRSCMTIRTQQTWMLAFSVPPSAARSAQRGGRGPSVVTVRSHSARIASPEGSPSPPENSLAPVPRHDFSSGGAGRPCRECFQLIPRRGLGGGPQLPAAAASFPAVDGLTSGGRLGNSDAFGQVGEFKL